MRINTVLATGLALIAVAVFLALLHSPATVAATNGVSPTKIVAAANAHSDATACQYRETLPRGTSAIRLALDATTGPPVSVEVYAGSHIVTRGTVGSGWYGSTVTVPVKPVDQTYAPVKLCFGLSELSGNVFLFGSYAGPHAGTVAGGKVLRKRMRVEYLRPLNRSWWSLAAAVIRHMGLGRAASGTWIVLLITALMAGAIVLGVWVSSRELG